jgi:hypothetical protein
LDSRMQQRGTVSAGLIRSQGRTALGHAPALLSMEAKGRCGVESGLWDWISSVIRIRGN